MVLPHSKLVERPLRSLRTATAEILPRVTERVLESSHNDMADGAQRHQPSDAGQQQCVLRRTSIRGQRGSRELPSTVLRIRALQDALGESRLLASLLDTAAPSFASPRSWAAPRRTPANLADGSLLQHYLV